MASSGRDWFSNLPLQTTAASSSSRSATRRAEMPTDLAVYSVENFEPRPPQELVCTVCRGVYREPVECPCRHVFCSICIHGWLAHSASPGSGSCPLCRREMTVSQVVPVVPIVNNMIAHLTVRCPNREAGCIAKMTLESVNHHLETCEFNRALCPDCGAQMRASELSSHQLEQCSKRLVRCTRGCCFSLLAERQRDHNCIYEMRNYISSLEQTRDMLRHQLDHTLQCLSRLQRQIRELAVRVEACAVRVRELGAAPSAQRVHVRTEGPPKTSRLMTYRSQLSKESRLPWRDICGSSNTTRSPDTPSHLLRLQIPVPDPVHPSWDMPADPEASLSDSNQEDLAEQCASAFKLFPNDGRTASLFHDTDGSCCQTGFKTSAPTETTNGIDGGAFIPSTAPTGNSTFRPTVSQPYRFTFGVAMTSEPSGIHSVPPFRMPPTLQSTSTSTRLSVPTVSEMLAASTPLTVTSSAALNETSGGTHSSPSDLATERAPELHFNTTVSGSDASEGWYSPPAAWYSLHAEVASSIRAPLHPGYMTPRNVDDADMEYGQLSDGGGHLSSMMRRLWVGGRHHDGSNSPPAE
ncbi:hypothetical protein MTO96_027853 [Rhipicephalus appendiculatus]|uniref:E3 ubiquitin-protein ligase NRDP1 n=1 Tax=Rhipicephalus appendiculatus TaxID=34631 RepID=A0A131Z4C8_RHIAP